MQLLPQKTTWLLTASTALYTVLRQINCSKESVLLRDFAKLFTTREHFLKAWNIYGPMGHFKLNTWLINKGGEEITTDRQDCSGIKWKQLPSVSLTEVSKKQMWHAVLLKSNFYITSFLAFSMTSKFIGLHVSIVLRLTKRKQIYIKNCKRTFDTNI